MNLPCAKKLIHEDFSSKTCSLLAHAVRKGYAIAVTDLESIEWLNWRVGYDIKSILKRVAVEYQIKKLVDEGKLPFKYNIAPNAADNCYHIELITKHFIVTFSQVNYQRALPRRAIYRSNHSLSNQLSWDFFSENKNIPIREEPYYAILTYGYTGREPAFVSLGVPEPHVAGWIYKIDLLSELSLIEAPEIEIISEESLVEFRIIYFRRR